MSWSVASTVGWFRINPFEQSHTVRAEFAQVSNLAVRSPVRIAGVEVGKVTQGRAAQGGGARVTMELKPSALPLHEDARLKVRSRIFLEGNFFVDLQPGTPASPELGDDDVIPARQTSAPVLLGDVLTTLQRDTRTDLQTLLRELSTGLGDGAAESLNRRAPATPPRRCATWRWPPTHRWASSPPRTSSASCAAPPASTARCPRTRRR